MTKIVTTGGSGVGPAKMPGLASPARIIVERRQRAGLTQRNLADAAKVPLTRISEIESGKRIADDATMAKLDRAFEKAMKRKTRR